MNWIARELKAGRTAREKGPEVWRGLCNCFAEAVAEYANGCSAGPDRASIHVIDNSATVTWAGSGGNSRLCSIEFEPSTGVFSFFYPSRSPSCLRGPLTLTTSSDDRGAMCLLMNGKGITFEQCSELVLRWVLFGDTGTEQQPRL